ncbi:MAG: tail fiber domain-containing protein [Methanobrevibacter sp.]|nr:tail fiber domain-containing protein [Methanobrevibacter sp.]
MAVIKQIKDSAGNLHDIINTDTKDTAGISTTTRPLYLIGTYINETSANSLPEKIATTHSCGDLIVVDPTTGKLSAEIINTGELNTPQFYAQLLSGRKITIGDFIVDTPSAVTSMSLGENFSVSQSGAVSAESININNSLNVGTHFIVDSSGAVSAGSIVCDTNATVSGNIVVGSGTGDTVPSPTSGVLKCNTLTCFAAGSTDTSIIVRGYDGTITAEGDITAKGFYQSSDERLKTFTEEYDINLDDIKNIKTGRFYWNSDDNRVINGGVTAQSVEKYFPELVKEDENGTKTVNYDGLAVVAIAAIKKLTERIEELENIVYNK